MRLNSKKLFLVGAFALLATASFGQVTEPIDSTAVDQDVTLTETLVIGKGVIDIAEDRKTPVAVSTITKEEIQNKAMGNVDFPEIFNTTPSVYVSDQSSGFGDSKLYLRGFSSQNTAYLLNGQPINGMEDGNLYWSNWSAMTEVANSVQIQRGLGSSKLAISSVGGTVNMVTRATEKKEGGYVRFNVGNDSYFGATVAYNTGMKGKWGVSLLFNHWQAHRNFALGTNGEGQAYFVSVGYKPSDRHQFNFMIFGAPQQHGQNYSTKSETQWTRGAKFGKKYNSTYGYLDGEGKNLRNNYYHKPVANLNWDWTMNENASLSTVIYASTGTGGGTSGVGKATSTGNLSSVGLVDFDKLVADNLTVTDGIGGSGVSSAIRTSVNNHFWYGGVTNFNYDTKTGWNFNVGADVRFYKGYHFQQMNDLLGLNSWNQKRNYDGATINVTETFSTNPWSALFKYAGKDQRTNRDYREDINYQGGFGQVEYSLNGFTVFAQGAISNQYYRKFDTWNYGGVETASKKINKTGWNIKGGLAYKFADHNTVFANAGKYSRQPFLDNVFKYNTVDIQTEGNKNEEITSYEIGYKYAKRNFKFNVNAYYTTWGNRFLGISSNQVIDGIDTQIYTAFFDIQQVHKGIEIDFDTKVSRAFGLYGFLSLGDWKYDGKTPYEKRATEDNRVIETGSVDLKGTYIGEAAQVTLGLGTKVHFTKNLYWDVDFLYNGKIYGQVDTQKVVTYSQAGQTYQAEQIAPFFRANTGVSYEFKLGTQKIKFRGNVRNLFNDQYVLKIDSNGYGYATGRTWTAGVTYSF